MTPPPESPPGGQTWPVRLRPGEDLRTALQAVVAARGASAAFVLAGIGSLRPACVRLAGAEVELRLDGDVELLSLSGTIAANGVHLHLSVAAGAGRVIGGQRFVPVYRLTFLRFQRAPHMIAFLPVIRDD